MTNLREAQTRAAWIALRLQEFVKADDPDLADLCAVFDEIDKVAHLLRKIGAPI